MERMPKKNLTAKILAFLLAIVLWVYVMNEQNPPIETTMDAAFEVRNVAASYTVLDAPDAVKVKVRGPRSMILAFTGNEVKCYVDAKGLTEGRHSLKVYAVMPAGMEVLEIIPDKVTLRLDTIVNKPIPIEVKLTGTPVSGIGVGNAAASVAFVNVDGPKSRLDNVVKAVATVDVTGRNADFKVNAPLVLVNAEGKEVEGLNMTPNQTEVNLTLSSTLRKKMVDVRPNTTGALAKDIKLQQISLNPAKVEISGNAAVIDKLEFLYTEPLHLEEINKDAIFELSLIPPEGVALSRNKIRVQVKIEKQL